MALLGDGTTVGGLLIVIVADYCHEHIPNLSSKNHFHVSKEQAWFAKYYVFQER
jgi:hypothetical protein